MFRIIYRVAADRSEDELLWLKEQKIFPACEFTWDWKGEKPMYRIGVIVDSEAALSIKLRNKIDTWIPYKQK